MSDKKHIPVLLQEALDCLDVMREGVYVDGTLGLAGHSLEILKKNPKASIIGFDIDEKSLMEAKKFLKPYADRVRLYLADFRYLSDLNLDFSAIRGILLDLGISSFQLDSPERGFSFSQEGPLDMRLDFRNKITAFKIIDKSSESHLAEIFLRFGELKQARRLAREIVSRRKVKKIETTTQLCAIIEEVCQWRPQKGKIHPAAKAFQALRIAVNRELDGLGEFLDTVVQNVSPQTRLAVISFHSLEDRIIKHTFARWAKPADGRPLLRLLTKKPIIPTEDEIRANSRSRSAKLRAAERT